MKKIVKDTSLVGALAIMACIGLGQVSASAAGPSTGNGTGQYQLEGFTPVESPRINKAIGQAIALIERLEVVANPKLPELAKLIEQIQFTQYIRVNKDIQIEPNRNPGDYHVGTFLVASTETRLGAPTKIYPALFRLGDQLSDTQLQQMVIHEALHRALPAPMNSYEAAVVRLTALLTQDDPSKVAINIETYLIWVRNQKVPWVIYRMNDFSTNDLKVLQPLLNDKTIAFSTTDNTRISIKIQTINKKGYIGIISYDTSQILTVDIIDRYSQISYSFMKDTDLDRASLNELNQLATEFIRESIQTIQENLNW